MTKHTLTKTYAYIDTMRIGDVFSIWLRKRDVKRIRAALRMRKSRGGKAYKMRATTIHKSYEYNCELKITREK